MTQINAINLDPDWREQLIAWAVETAAVREVWIFGSRGPKGGARPDSDLDVGIVLAPPLGNHDWALGDLFTLGDGWQAHLAGLVGKHVSLEGMLPGSDGDIEIRSTGMQIWAREPP